MDCPDLSVRKLRKITVDTKGWLRSCLEIFSLFPCTYRVPISSREKHIFFSIFALNNNVGNSLKFAEKICVSLTFAVKKKISQFIYFCTFMPPRPRPAGDIERSGFPYVRPSEDQVKIFGQGRISRPINGRKLIFRLRIYLYETSRYIQEPLPHDLYFTVHWLRTWGQIIKVNILVQGRISRPINGSKLIFHMRMYVYEISRNIQEPWPSDLYSLSADFRLWPIVHG